MASMSLGDGFSLAAIRVGPDLAVYYLPDDPDDYDAAARTTIMVPAALAGTIGAMLMAAAKEAA